MQSNKLRATGCVKPLLRIGRIGCLKGQMNKHYPLKGILALAIAILASATMSQAQLLLSVDFGVTSSPVETGYSAFGITSGTLAGPSTKSYTGISNLYTTGTVAVTIASGNTVTATGNLTARDRTAPSTNSGTFTYSDIYRDFINPSSGGNLTLGLTGLNANTQYTLTLYAYDNANSRTVTYTDYTTGSAGASGSISYTAGYTFGSTTPDSIFSTILTVTSDANGSLVIRATPSSGGAIINGLQLSAVPEPSTVALCFLAVGIVALRARRSNHWSK